MDQKISTLEIESIIEKLKKLGKYKYELKFVIDVYYEDNPSFSVFPDDKYIQFHDEFVQNGMLIPKIKETVESIIDDTWETNSD